MISAEVIEDNLSFDLSFEDITAQDSSLLEIFYQLYIEDDYLQLEHPQSTDKEFSISRVPAFSRVRERHISDPPLLIPPIKDNTDSPPRLSFPQNLLRQHSKRSLWSCNTRCFDSNFPQRQIPNLVHFASPVILPLLEDKISVVDSTNRLERGEAAFGAYYPYYYFDIHIDVSDVLAQESQLNIRQHNQSSLHRGLCSVEDDWRAVQGSCHRRRQWEGWKLVYPYNASYLPTPARGIDLPFLADDITSLLLKAVGLLMLTLLVVCRLIRRPKSSVGRTAKDASTFLLEEAYVRDLIARKREALQRQQQLLLQKKLDKVSKRSRGDEVPELHELYIKSGKTSPPSVNNPLFTAIYRQRSGSFAHDVAESLLDDASAVKRSQTPPNNPNNNPHPHANPDPASPPHPFHLSPIPSAPLSPRKILSLQRIKRVEVHSPPSRNRLSHDTTLAVSSSSASSASSSTFPQLFNLTEVEEVEEVEGQVKEEEEVEEEIRIEIEVDEEEDEEVPSSVRSSPVIDFSEIYPLTSQRDELLPVTLNPFPTTPITTTTRHDDPNQPNNTNNVSGDGKTSREGSNDSEDTSSVEFMLLDDVAPLFLTEKGDLEEEEEIEEEIEEDIEVDVEVEAEDDDDDDDDGYSDVDVDVHREEVRRGEEEIDDEIEVEVEGEGDDVFASQSVVSERSPTPHLTVTSASLVEEEVETSLPLGSPSLFVWRYRAAQSDDVAALEMMSVGEEEVSSKEEREVVVVLDDFAEREEVDDVTSDPSPVKWKESRYKLDHHLLATPPRNCLPPLPQTLPQTGRRHLPPLDNRPHPHPNPTNALPFPSNTLLSDESSVASQSTASSLSASSSQLRSSKQMKEEFIRRATSSASSRSVSPSNSTTSSTSAAPLPIHSRATDLPLISLENTIVRSFRTKYDLLKNVSLLQQRYNICFPRRYSPATLTTPPKDSSLLRSTDSSSPTKSGGRRSGFLSPPSPSIYIRHERDIYEKLHSPRRALRGIRPERRSSTSTASSEPIVTDRSRHQTPLRSKSGDRRRVSLVTQSVDRFNFRVREQRDDGSEDADSVLAKSYDDISVEEILDLRKGFDRDFYQRLITTTARSSTSLPPVASSSYVGDVMRGTETSHTSNINLINSPSNVHTYSYDNKADVAQPPSHNNESDSDNDTVSYDERQRQRQERH